MLTTESQWLILGSGIHFTALSTWNSPSTCQITFLQPSTKDGPGKFPQNGDQLPMPRKPSFANSSSHHWENISSKVCIKWMVIWIIPKISFNSEKKNFLKKKKNQISDGQEASKPKEYTISRRMDTYIWIAQVFYRLFFISKKSQWVHTEQLLSSVRFFVTPPLHGLQVPSSSVHRDSLGKNRILEWVAMPSSRGSSQARDRTQVSRIAGRFFTVWATREADTEQYIIKYSISSRSPKLFPET